MADKLPLKIKDGQIQQFEVGDTISATIAPGSGGGLTNLDGGFANSTYLTPQSIDGGTA